LPLEKNAYYKEVARRRNRLDSNQQFYQVIADEQSRVVPCFVDDFFERFLQPTVYTYNVLGVPAKYKPINDVVVDGKKISGNGAGKLGKAAILVGNIILDLDYDSMTRVFEVPDEKFQYKLAKSIREWVTSLKREVGYIPSRSQIKKALLEGYRKLVLTWF
jgi:lipoate-protein ligase A